MNILPKKRWHVRNRDNIARVRKDEAKAEEERRKKEERQKLAEREARTEFLREKARERVGCKDFIPLSSTSSHPTSHINFFEELENGQEESRRPNKEHEKEKKEETEVYEKKIGYLTYLGQDTNEALGKKHWYEQVPNRNVSENEEVDTKCKLKEDPLELIHKYIPTSFKNKNLSIDTFPTKKDSITEYPSKHKREHKKKDRHKNKKMKGHSELSCRKKKRKHLELYESDSSNDSSSSKKKKLELLRAERLQREKKERQKANALFADIKTSSSCSETINRKYNSQFNPDIARQNSYN